MKKKNLNSIMSSNIPNYTYKNTHISQTRLSPRLLNKRQKLSYFLWSTNLPTFTVTNLHDPLTLWLLYLTLRCLSCFTKMSRKCFRSVRNLTVWTSSATHPGQHAQTYSLLFIYYLAFSFSLSANSIM